MSILPSLFSVHFLIFVNFLVYGIITCWFTFSFIFSFYGLTGIARFLLFIVLCDRTYTCCCFVLARLFCWRDWFPPSRQGGRVFVYVILLWFYSSHFSLLLPPPALQAWVGGIVTTGSFSFFDFSLLGPFLYTSFHGLSSHFSASCEGVVFTYYRLHTMPSLFLFLLGWLYRYWVD